ncbi:MAG TPA: hypothetical protein DHW45_11230 [Candidatus Latescibacteria bacterium]|jgi:geranylgeranylglycerol-phosphate geranylgeranyltransferase|nr:hypothetical protein [Candidatus Latescibacterota bacterium]
MGSSKLLPYIAIVRPLNVCLTAGGVLLGGWLAVANLSPLLWLASLSAALIAAAGYVQNDLVDIEIDRINHPDRPLPRGTVSGRFARTFSAIAYTIGLIVSIPLPIACRILALGIVGSLFLYNIWLKHLPLVGNLIVAATGGAPFAFGGLTVELVAPSLLPASLAVIFHLSREILKDVQDRMGDERASIATLPVLAGETASKTIVTVLLLGLVVAIPLPAFWNWAGPAFLLLGLALSALLILTVCLVWQAQEDALLERPSRLLKAGMLLGIAAFLLDSLIS